MTDSISRAFARFGAATAFDSLPPDVVDHVKALVLQGLTSAMAGAAHPAAGRIVDTIKADEAVVSGGAAILADGVRVTRGTQFAFTAPELSADVRMRVPLSAERLRKLVDALGRA